MSKENRVICDVCERPIPYITENGYLIRTGCEYMHVTIELMDTVLLPPDEDESETYPKTLDICPWCKEEIVIRSKRKRRKIWRW